MNDLSATALGTVLLHRGELYCLNDKDPDPTGVIGIVAPGTGLGLSLMVQVNNNFVPLPSEGGHADFAPRNEHEVALWRLLHKNLGHVSVERLVSGPGIYKIYKTLRQIRDHEEPHWPESQAFDQDPSAAVSRAALEDKDELSLQAIRMFCEMFGAVAGNLALIGFTTGGIYLAGGVPKKILPFLKEDHFMNAFLDKGRFRSLLESIPVRVVLNEKTALMGAAKCALDM
jgi:glucokinase